MTYDIPYFIKKFEAIPSKEWCMGDFFNDEGRRCALGHCGKDWGTPMPPEAKSLIMFFDDHHGSVSITNDNTKSGSKTFKNENLGQGKLTPRSRILAALRWMQKQEAK